jgi:hypothetical protein
MRPLLMISTSYAALRPRASRSAPRISTKRGLEGWELVAMIPLQNTAVAMLKRVRSRSRDRVAGALVEDIQA